MGEGCLRGGGLYEPYMSNRKVRRGEGEEGAGAGGRGEQGGRHVHQSAWAEARRPRCWAGGRAAARPADRTVGRPDGRRAMGAADRAGEAGAPDAAGATRAPDVGDGGWGERALGALMRARRAGRAAAADARADEPHPRLLVGAAGAARDVAALADRGVTHVLTLGHGMDMLSAECGLVRATVPVADEATAAAAAQLEAGLPEGARQRAASRSGRASLAPRSL